MNKQSKCERALGTRPWDGQREGSRTPCSHVGVRPHKLKKNTLHRKIECGKSQSGEQHWANGQRKNTTEGVYYCEKKKHLGGGSKLGRA